MVLYKEHIAGLKSPQELSESPDLGIKRSFLLGQRTSEKNILGKTVRKKEHSR